MPDTSVQVELVGEIAQALAEPRRFGAKAANTARLQHAGILVPSSWVIPGDVLTPFLRDAGFTVVDGGVALGEASAVSRWLEDSPPPLLYQSLVQQLRPIVSSHRGSAWVVRSSHAYEDRGISSFAGLFHTELNLRKCGDLVNAAFRCWRRCFEVGVAEYCRMLGIGTIQPSALLLQQLIDSRAGGVLFRQGANVLLQANWGLAKSVVDGIGGADEWASTGGDEGRLRVGDKRLALLPIRNRTHISVADRIHCLQLPGSPSLVVERVEAETRIATVRLAEDLGNDACLQPEELRQLICCAEQSVRALSMAESADIEWSMTTTSEIVILQIRPLTRPLAATPTMVAETLRGLPIVSGVVTGRVVRVRTEREARAFPAGAILLCTRLEGPTLSPAARARACMIETESQLSHSAIIARELGVPTIGMVKCDSITDGRWYRVDGATGEISEVEPPSELDAAPDATVARESESESDSIAADAHASFFPLLPEFGEDGWPDVQIKVRAAQPIDGTSRRPVPPDFTECARRRRAAVAATTLAGASNEIRGITIGYPTTQIIFSSRIPWLGEVYLQGRQRLPETLFGDAPFESFAQARDELILDSSTWLSFFDRCWSLFLDGGVPLTQFAHRVRSTLIGYHSSVSEGHERWSQHGRLSFAELREQFDLFAGATSYSIVNHFIPLAWFREVFDQLDLSCEGAGVDQLLISMVVPHRVQLRRAKLLLALEELQLGGPSWTSLDQFRREYAPLEHLEEWCFDDNYLSDARIIRRQVREIAACMSPQQLREELEQIESGRHKALFRRRQTLAAAASRARQKYSETEAWRILGAMAFLAVVATEEEVRHIIQARHLILLGRVLRSLELNPGHVTLQEILYAARGAWS